VKIAELSIPEAVKELVIKSGIVELYPPQEEAIKAGALEGKNLVLASPTASGKTLVAELCALKHILEKNGKTVYLTPLRALANEKFEEFRKYTTVMKKGDRKIRVGISTGDFDSTDPWLERYDIIVTSVDYEEPIIIRENKMVKVERIGRVIDNLMRSSKEQVRNECGTEILDVVDMNLQAAALDPTSLKVNFKNISNVVRHKTDEFLCKLRLQTGRETTVTKNHSIYALEGLNVATKNASEIRLGDFVLIPKSLPLNQLEETEIDLLRELGKLKINNLFLKNLTPDFYESASFKALKAKESDKKNWKKRRELPFDIVVESGLYDISDASPFFSYVGSRHKVPTKIPISAELIRLIGYYVAEGSIDEDNHRISLAFGSKDVDNIKDACKCTEALFNFKPSVYERGKATYVDVCDKIVCLIFNKILKLPHGARKKSVPSIIFNMNLHLQHEFLQSLVAGDGIFEPRLGLVTSSKYLASDFLYLLLQSGVVAGLSHTKTNSRLPSGKTVHAEHYETYVDTRSHLKSLGIDSTRGQNLRSRDSARVCMVPTNSLKGILTTLCRRSSDGSLVHFGKRTSKTRFVQWLNAKEIRIKLELLQTLRTKSTTSGQLSEQFSVPWCTLNGRLTCLLRKGLVERHGKSGHYTYSISNKGSDLLQETEKARKLFDSDLAFAKVIKIERVKPSKNHVYDVSIPFCENFVAGMGGVICHNTNEKADSLLRHRAKWMDEISLVVADEIHLLNEAERGPTLEVVLARLMQVNPDVQILALSATINNVDEIAQWLKADYVTTEWRPVALKEGVLLQEEIQYKDGDARKIEKKTRDSLMNLVLSTVKTGGQALVFTSTRKNAATLAKKLAGEVEEILSKPAKRALEHEANRILVAGERTRLSESLAELVKRGTAFHHAGLGGGHRRIIEDSFRQGKIKVLTATPTLAFGVNLPARTVVIQDYRRYEAGYGYYPISVLEYKQMAGRAGRPKYDKTGEAILIAKTNDEADYLIESYVLARPERIWSRLAVERILRSHVLATIAADFAHTENGIYEFFGKTFYAYQYDTQAIKGIISKILKYLYDEDMIEAMGENINATKFGKRVSDLYIDPVSAVIIRDALKRKPDFLTDISFLHMIAHTPDMGPVLRPYSREMDEVTVFMEEHKTELLTDVPDELEDRIAYEEFLGEMKTAMTLKAWIEEISEDELIERFRVQPGDLYRTIENAKWLLHATHELTMLFGRKQMLPQTQEIRQRVEKGVKKELLPLVKLEGVGRVRGRIIYNSGYKTVEDIKRAPIEDLTNLPLIGPRLAKKIKEQLGGFIKKEAWEKLEREDEWKQKALTEY
jgi:helicase